MALPCRPAQENGVLPGHGWQQKIPILQLRVEVFAYSAAHIADFENDILFMV